VEAAHSANPRVQLTLVDVGHGRHHCTFWGSEVFVPGQWATGTIERSRREFRGAVQYFFKGRPGATAAMIERFQLAREPHWYAKEDDRLDEIGNRVVAAGSDRERIAVAVDEPFSVLRGDRLELSRDRKRVVSVNRIGPRALGAGGVVVRAVVVRMDRERGAEDVERGCACGGLPTANPVFTCSVEGCRERTPRWRYVPVLFTLRADTGEEIVARADDLVLTELFLFPADLLARDDSARGQLRLLQSDLLKPGNAWFRFYLNQARTVLQGIEF
jgi:hypothetical protein